MKKLFGKISCILIAAVLLFTLCGNTAYAKYSGTDNYWDKYSSDYLYRQMNASQKALYDRLYETCEKYLSGNGSFSNYYDGRYYTDFVEYDRALGTVHSDSLAVVLQAFANSNPQFYFVACDSFLSEGNRVAVSIYDDFRDGAVRAGYTAQLRNMLDNYLIEINREASPVEKERKAYNIIKDKLTYNLNAKYHQSSASAFFTSSSVCAGYTEGLEMLLNGAGFECIPLTSTFKERDGQSTGHEWLEVKLDGTWYAVDVTWGENDSYFRSYFNTSDDYLYLQDRRSNSVGAHVADKIYAAMNIPPCNYIYPMRDPFPDPDPDPEPEPVDPEPVDPEPVDPEPVDPEPVDPEPVDPDPVDPEPVDPDPVDPDPVAPQPDGTGADDYGISGFYKDADGNIALFRLFNPVSGEHFYSQDIRERRALINSGLWKGEGITGYYPAYSARPVYRLVNNASGDHLYTTSAREMIYQSTNGWNYEKIAFYSEGGSGAPVFRLFNPNAASAAHHYTDSSKERDWLSSHGWKYEEEAWYSVKNGGIVMGEVYDRLQKALASVREKTDFVPKVALVLGSGLGGYADSGKLEVAATVDYKDIPGFPVSTAPGHVGRFVFGYVGENKVPVVCMQGRVHYYEGYDMEDVVLPIRLMKLMGADTLFLTNAAGGINPDFSAGDLMLISDHISFFLPSPLRGENMNELGVRFPDMSDVYDKTLRELAHEKAAELSIDLKEGVYAQTKGPNYESPAEIRFLKTIGADAVGMSTACEAIAANHMNMHIIGISCISNLAAGISPTPLSEEEVLEAGRAVAPKFTALVTEIINSIE